MILALDTGNSHIVMGIIHTDGRIGPTMRMETNHTKTEYEYAAEMKLILELAGVNIRECEGAIISSVVPPVTPVLKKAVKILSGMEAIVVGAGVKTGIDIGLDDPGTIGADLVATAVAAKNYYPLPCIIIDMGTATTITVVNDKGRYIGGCIMPGVNLSLNALTEGTSLLPGIDLVLPQKTICTNTGDAIKTGIIFGASGALDGVLDRYLEELGENTSIVATGGLSRMICPVCRHEIELDENLLMRGLWVIWEKTMKSRSRKKRDLKEV